MNDWITIGNLEDIPRQDACVVQTASGEAVLPDKAAPGATRCESTAA